MSHHGLMWRNIRGPVDILRTACRFSDDCVRQLPEPRKTPLAPAPSGFSALEGPPRTDGKKCPKRWRGPLRGPWLGWRAAAAALGWRWRRRLGCRRDAGARALRARHCALSERVHGCAKSAATSGDERCGAAPFSCTRSPAHVSMGHLRLDSRTAARTASRREPPDDSSLPWWATAAK